MRAEMRVLPKLKKDKYLRERGGTAKVQNIVCSKCGEALFVYQKDGPGWLKRAYLNRIVAPEIFSKLQYQYSADNFKTMKNLVCPCNNLIGTPILYRDGRIAYHLERGSFQRKPLTKSFQHS